MEQQPQLIVCEDGSHTLFLPALNETYHSTRGAIPESVHVYLNQGYRNLLRPETLHVLEIGFGTGLNALLTLIDALELRQHTYYHSLEPFPLPAEIWSHLNYGTLLGHQEHWQQLQKASWGSSHALNEYFTVLKDRVKLEEVKLKENFFDLVYFDGFAPRKQAEIWSLANIQKLYKAMKQEAVMVTYTASAQLRRDLKQTGFEVELLKGPPGKREMTRATKL